MFEEIRRNKKSPDHSFAWRMLPLASFAFQPEKTKAMMAETHRMLLTCLDLSLTESLSTLAKIDKKHSLLHLLCLPNGVGKVLHQLQLEYLLTIPVHRCWLDFHGTAVQTLLALKAYRQDNGELPNSLAKLIPKYMDELPTDPFDGKSMRYNKAKMIIYSVGKNLKDEGGLVEYEDPEHPNRRKSKDIVFDIEF